MAGVQLKQAMEVVLGGLVDTQKMCSLHVKFVGDVQFGAMCPQKTPISVIGAVNIHCTDCAQQLSMTFSSWLPFKININSKAEEGSTPSSPLPSSPDPLQTV